MPLILVEIELGDSIDLELRNFVVLCLLYYTLVHIDHLLFSSYKMPIFAMGWSLATISPDYKRYGDMVYYSGDTGWQRIPPLIGS